MFLFQKKEKRKKLVIFYIPKDNKFLETEIDELIEEIEARKDYA